MNSFHVALLVLCTFYADNSEATSLNILSPNDSIVDMFNSSCGMSCSMLMDIGPPPDLILTIPPPPLPSSFDREQAGKVLSVGEKCNFCEWAFANTGDIPIHKKSGFAGTSWIMITVIVSVLSTIIIFTLILVILQCNNIKIFPVSACPFLAGPSSTKKSASKSEDKVTPTLVQKEHTKPYSHLWHQGTSQEKPLQTPSSQCSEANSYSGEPYRSDSIDSQPVYSEINIRSDTSSTIYSEVAEPPPLPNVLGPVRKLLTEGAYENAAFLTSESQAGLPNATFHTGGSLRTPKVKKPRSEPVPKPDKSAEDPVRQESPYYYKQTDQQLPARKPLPLLPSQRMRSLPRRPLPSTPPAPALV